MSDDDWRLGALAWVGLKIILIVTAFAGGLIFLPYALVLGRRGEYSAAAFCGYVGALCVTVGVSLCLI